MTTKTYSKTEVDSNAIWLGSPQQPYRQGCVIKQEVQMIAGQTAIVMGEGEGSIYQYPWDGSKFTFPMFASSCLYAFAPGITPPWIYPVGMIPGSTLISQGSGMDIRIDANYYTPQNKNGVFVAPDDGIYTFAMYWWGGSTEAGTGNAACVYPGSSRINVVVID